MESHLQLVRSCGSPLRHNRQGQVIASTACVADLEVIAVAREDRAVRQVAERAGNRVGRGVVNHSEHCACGQRAGASIDKSKRHVAGNGHAEGGGFRRFGPSPVQHTLVGRERVEGQRVIDGQGAGFSCTIAGREDCSGACSCSDRHRAVDFARSTECAGVDPHRARARGGAGYISNQERAVGDGGAPSVGVSVSQSQLAPPSLGERAARATDCFRHPGSRPEKVVLRLFVPTVRLLAPRNTAPFPCIDPVVTPGAS